LCLKVKPPYFAQKSSRILKKINKKADKNSQKRPTPQLKIREKSG
jgi:hypothetical protein